MTTYTDGSDALATNFKYTIDFFHMPSGEGVSFKAFLTSFSDTFEADWGEEEVYGRMDPIVTYKGTKRKISLEWELVAASIEEGKGNMAKCTTLFGMLYPSFTAGEHRVVNRPPLFRVKFINFVQNAGASTGSTSTGGGTAESSGLVCTVSGFSYSPDIDAGFMHDSIGVVYPQTIKLSCDLTILHTHQLGYNDGSRAQANFPYGMSGGTSAPQNQNSGGNTQAQQGAAQRRMTGEDQ